MKKLLSLLVLLIFYKNVNSQSYVPLEDTIKFRSVNYTPKLTIYNDRYIYVDTLLSERTELPPLEWAWIQSRPDFKSVAYSGNYNDLSYSPDLNHLPNYYEKGTIDTMCKNIHWFPDWNVSGDILNKPSIVTPTITGTGITTVTGSYPTLVISTPSITSSQITAALGTPALTVEIDGSVTNEIELPNQSGNSGKFLITNGSAPSWSPALISEVDGSITNEIQTISRSSNTVTLSNGGGSFTLTPVTDSQTLSISGNVLSVSGGNSITIPSNTIVAAYTNTASVSGGSGNAVFYLTSDKTSTGTALYANGNVFPNPIVNDSSNNYTYGWSYNSSTRALTVNVKQNGTAILSLINVLTGPANVSNGTVVQVTVNGN